MVKIKLVDLVARELTGKEAVYSVPKGKNPISIGRGKDADVVLFEGLDGETKNAILFDEQNSRVYRNSCLEVSRRHCLIGQERGNFYVEDDNSEHWTYANGRLVVSSTPLADGSIISLGKNYKLQVFFQDEDEGSSADEIGLALEEK